MEKDKLEADLAKKELRIELILEANRNANKIIEEEINLKTKALAELEKAKEDLKDQKHFAQTMIDIGADFEGERDKLQQENAKLKEEVETVRLESYGEALKNKKLRELLSEERKKDLTKRKK